MVGSTVAGLVGHMSAFLFRNIAEHLQLASLRFSGRHDGWTLAGIHMVNFWAVVLSCGLALPWAKLRVYRYRMECLAIVALGGLMDDFNAIRAPSNAHHDAQRPHLSL